MQGVVDPLIKELGRYHVLDLNSREAYLEETFLALHGQEDRRDLFDTLPETYRALFAGSSTIDLSTAGAAAIAAEEDRGGLEVILSAPVSRLQVFIQRLADLVIGIVTSPWAPSPAERPPPAAWPRW